MSNLCYNGNWHLFPIYKTGFRMIQYECRMYLNLAIGSGEEF